MDAWTPPMLNPLMPVLHIHMQSWTYCLQSLVNVPLQGSASPKAELRLLEVEDKTDNLAHIR